ncbi:MAG: tyrosine--tRNA ligase [Rickettsia sp.]|nr:tyrosine--tRNA ligase [Rickettsia sp.]
MSLISELRELGFIHQCSNPEELDDLLQEGKVVFYLGFDCTARSLHIGNLMSVMLLRKLQKYGNKPIIIIGGGTTKIGDPSGKDSERKEISSEEIEKNIQGIKKSLSKFLITDQTKSQAAIIVNNQTWLEELKYIEFLKKYGRYFSVNKMLTMESVKSRLQRQSHLSFLEFNYMLLQAYDFYQLNKRFDCNLQIGGSDQWGNIIFGADLIQNISKTKAYALTTPLITTADGKKMGKTAQGATWLNEDMYSSYQYYQYWQNTNDKDVVKFAKIFCDFNKHELENFIAEAKKNIVKAKTTLAYRLTELCHTKKNAEQSYIASKEIFEKHGISKNVLPKFYVKKSEILAKKIFLYQILKISGLTSSYTESKKAILNNAIKINNNLIQERDHIISIQNFNNLDYLKLSFGKKKHILLEIK